MKTIATRTPPLTALRAFEAVARLGNLSQAAAELHVTKSAVSHQLRALEADLGATLLKRGGKLRRAEPTEIGWGLLASVRHSLSLLEAACRSTRAAAQGEERRRIRISANASFASLWLVPRLGGFMSQRPDVDVEVRLHTNQAPSWKAGDIDVAFLHVRDQGPHRMHADDVPLMRETIVPVCSPGLIAPAYRTDPEVFRRHRLIIEKHVASPETSWRTWQARLQLAEATWCEPLVLHGMSAVVSAAVAGLGIALGRLPLIDAELADQRLVKLMPDAEMEGSWRYVIRPRPEQTIDEATAEFIDFCVAQCVDDTTLKTTVRTIART
ncbi:LysR substrate-binding domain-containing protein [Chitinasiproducens palmae]|uniref:Transcriptional regulator, LysR family n=1 Tax=Chitinasiproducens palmae TaxID=1770053 RepID=A0A1H2PJ90_9BURK|nr:LysR substrate-binding domain-containing protein [Chitinasiproducens palmae]SDV46432.1 transcriptional regulator, LysR family [Chitinasiproducens palmae]